MKCPYNEKFSNKVTPDVGFVAWQTMRDISKHGKNYSSKE
jgi:hypothetical protein